MKKVLTGVFLMPIQKSIQNPEQAMADFQKALTRYVDLS